VATTTRRRSIVLLTAVLVVLTAACTQDIDISLSPGSTAPSTAPSTTTTIAPVLWPLTGLPSPGTVDVEQSAVIAKIDNSPAARPHAALSRADMVYEVWVEGITRFAAVYHSDIPERVGPVRSGRSTDVDLVANLGRPVLVWSGGNPNVNNELANAASFGVLINGGYDAQPNYYQRDGSRFAPNNLYADALALRDAIGDDGTSFPFPLYSFSSTAVEVPGDQVPGVSVSFGGGESVQYVWDEQEGCAVRYQDGQRFDDESGTAVCPKNVVIQFTPYGPSTADARSPQAYTVGAGTGLVYSQGRLALVAWNRPTPADGPNVVYADGQPAVLTPGRTWVALPPEDTSTVPMSPEQVAELVNG